MATKGRTIERVVYITAIAGFWALMLTCSPIFGATKPSRADTEQRMSEMDSLNVVLDLKYNNIVDELTRQKESALCRTPILILYWPILQKGRVT